jgi:hypothetical protein
MAGSFAPVPGAGKQAAGRALDMGGPWPIFRLA